MFYARSRLVAAIGLTAICGGLLVLPCRAGWFQRWFHGDPTVRTITAYPVSDNCFVAGATCQPATPAVMQSVVVGYSRQTAFRTRWTQVPLTAYRPITTTDPVTGCTVTCMRPCSTFQWQARRVAYRTCRPVVSTIAVNTAPVAVQPLPLDSTSTIPGFGMPSATEQPYSEGPADQVPTLPSDTVPGTFGPGATPPTVVPPGGASGSARGLAPPTQVSPAPISPYATGGSISNGGGATVQRPAASDLELSPGTGAVDSGSEPSAERPEPAREFRPELQDVPESGGVRLGPVVPDESQPEPRSAPATRDEAGPPLRPIPDPDEQPDAARPGPRDKVARREALRAERLRLVRDPRVRLVPIRWPGGPELGVDVAARQPLRPASSTTRLDDTGWQSISGVARHSAP